MFLSKVAEHVTIVTIDITTEDFDAVLRAELVDPHHQVFGTARQTHLKKKKKRQEGWSFLAAWPLLSIQYNAKFCN